jgi:hypothetical protein
MQVPSDLEISLPVTAMGTIALAIVVRECFWATWLHLAIMFFSMAGVFPELLQTMLARLYALMYWKMYARLFRPSKQTPQISIICSRGSLRAALAARFTTDSNSSLLASKLDSEQWRLK